MMPPQNQPRQIRDRPGVSLRVLFLALFMLASLGALSAKLWYEQMVNDQKWRSRLRKASEVTVRVPSVRGEIRDRNGVTLVANRASYCVDFYLPRIVKSFRDRVLEEHDKDKQRKKEERLNLQVPVVPYRTLRDGMLKDVEIEDIYRIVDSTVIPKFAKLGIARDYNADALERQFRTNEQVPFTYLDDVPYETVARLAENEAELSGVEIALRPVRQYIYGSFGVHVLGYVGAPDNINREPDIKKFSYYQPDIVGRSSVEKTYDTYLRGKPGRRILERSRSGKVVGEREEPPIPGSHVYLTIDARIQAIVEGALRASGVGRASAVVVNPNNGDILAMASVPNYDPNVFIPKISAEDMKRFDDDETDPLLNRCIRGYVPGSTYKVVTALAALHAGISPNRVFSCSGGIVYGSKTMKCWIAEKGGAHGGLSMLGGIKNSCNCYFFQLANSITAHGAETKTGLMEIEFIGKALGLGVRSNLPLSGESAGTLPGPAYLNARGLSALANSGGNIANTSIGQGMVEATPLQMAMVTATLANGGTSYYPRLVSRLVDNEGNDVRNPDGTFVVPVEPKIRASLTGLGIKPEDIEIVRRGMWKVVNEAGGTGRRAAIKGVEVAGKTGTAQFWRISGKDENGRDLKVKDNRVWFLCFAPYRDSKYAIVVMIEGAKSGGGVAAPVVQKILKECLALDAGYNPRIAYAEPVKGNFEHIDAIELKEDGSLTKLVAAAFQGTDHRPGDGDNEVSIRGEDGPVETRGTQTDGRPNVEATADARGQVGGRDGQRKQTFLERIFGPRKNNPNDNRKPGGLRR